ncbi:fimbrial protein [Stenotrophomonas maltophilia]|nr:fimbrial protein [Stenotrophomonas maltophilia]
MKRCVAATVASLFSVLAALPALANDSGTISITGNLVALSCEVDGGQGTGADVAVVLPQLSSDGMDAPGATGGYKPFSLTIRGNAQTCADGTGVSISFDQLNVDPQTGMLRNNGSADNVQVELLNSRNEPINLKDGSGLEPVKVDDQTALIEMGARYHATGATTAGDVSTAASYRLTYE